MDGKVSGWREGAFYKANTEKVGIKKREANASLFFITLTVPSAAQLMFLPTGKDIWNLEQTLYAHGLAFKVLNPHGFTTKDTGLEPCFLMREAFKGDNNC